MWETVLLSLITLSAVTQRVMTLKSPSGNCSTWARAAYSATGEQGRAETSTELVPRPWVLTGFFKCWCHPVSRQRTANHTALTPTRYSHQHLATAPALPLQSDYRWSHRKNKFGYNIGFGNNFHNVAQLAAFDSIWFHCKVLLARGREKDEKIVVAVGAFWDICHSIDLVT